MQERSEPGNEPRTEPISRQHHRDAGMGTGTKLALAAVVLLGAGYAWWQYSHPDAPPPPVARTVPAELAPAPAEPVAAAPAPVEPAPEPSHPIEPVADAQGHPPLEADARAAADTAVADWLGRERSLKFVATENFAQRTVATVDNLPRSQVAVRLWPLHPVGGRMAVTQTDDGRLQIAPENAARYDALVGFVSGIDPAQAAGLYRRIYPVLQHSYEELGYPGKRFNDRLVAVIDHLLQTPEPAAPLALQLVQVQGEVASQQPWLRYEFADAQLQSLSAGQKILVRMGVEHTQRIKALLRAVRTQITQGR